MQKKKVFETEYRAKEDHENKIKLPELKGHIIIEIVNEFSQKTLDNKDDYEWDKEKGILTLKQHESLLNGEQIVILSVESDPDKPRDGKP